VLAIRRADTGEWALPGGLGELDEDPRDTARRPGSTATRSPSGWPPCSPSGSPTPSTGRGHVFGYMTAATCPARAYPV